MPRRPSLPSPPLAPTAPRRRPGSEGMAEGRPEPPGPAVEPRPRRRPAPTPGAAAPRPTGRMRPQPEALRQEVLRPETRRVEGVRVAAAGAPHPLTDGTANETLRAYDERVKGSFDRIVPVLRRLSSLQHEEDFIAQAQRLAQAELGTELPLPILETAWVTQLDMRTLFAWCVFQAYEQTSDRFFREDPLAGGPGSAKARQFEEFLLACGFHLLDITPCADGRLAHAIAYALRLPFSAVRRRPHAGALFDVENTVNRWVKTEHRRYREGVPNPAHADTRYLKVVLYHFSSLDPSHEGCAAHGSDDALAARCGQQRLGDFQTAVENSFCCGASVDLLLMGIDTDTDAIRVHVPGLDGSTNLERWLDARDVYDATRGLGVAEGRARIQAMVEEAAAASPDPGMVRLIARLLEHNISQIDYVRQGHGGHYAMPSASSAWASASRRSTCATSPTSPTWTRSRRGLPTWMWG